MRDEYKAFRGGNMQDGWDYTDAQILLSYLSLFCRLSIKYWLLLVF